MDIEQGYRVAPSTNSKNLLKLLTYRMPIYKKDYHDYNRTERIEISQLERTEFPSVRSYDNLPRPYSLKPNYISPYDYKDTFCMTDEYKAKNNSI